jgi:hypothetical protein
MGYSREEERARVLETALGLPAADAVFKVEIYNEWNRRMGPPPYAGPIPLEALSSRASLPELQALQLRARAVLGAAYDLGDALLRRDGSYPEVRAAFEKAYPEFGETTYTDALNYGGFQAR